MNVDPRPFIGHMLLATAWVRYNSRSGKATEIQVSRVMRQISAADLRRMLTERNALPEGCEAVSQPLRLSGQGDQPRQSVHARQCAKEHTSTVRCHSHQSSTEQLGD